MKTITCFTAMVAITWAGLWFTPDQSGQRLMDQEEFEAAAQAFEDPMRVGVAWYRAGRI